ncbi:HIT family hydrolase [Pseudovibrio sp. FO-BEG1]|uniref:HIT family protein n=1 Tax=Pseudovibrio sp. (strain FO-BEG1) TaxID=911045 RepID=UPI000238C15D|nr:hydrolase [Pseudovibrio sp. FO-BEG1]AEV38878.1 HIT family hydrolase [Pseudovibrio sp. FO-BEG1]
MTDCFVCTKHKTLTSDLTIDIDGYDDFIVAHAPDRTEDGSNLIGALIIEPRTHVQNWSELPPEQAGKLGSLIGQITGLLYAHEEIEHVYTWVFGDAVAHLHVWLMPRYKGTPREYWGTKVTEWPEAPKGGHSEMAQFISELKELMTESA